MIPCSLKSLETKVLMGEHLGVRKGSELEPADEQRQAQAQDVNAHTQVGRESVCMCVLDINIPDMIAAAQHVKAHTQVGRKRVCLCAQGRYCSCRRTMATQEDECVAAAGSG